MQELLLQIWKLPRILARVLIRGYQLMISPWFPPSCRFTPTCSHYALQSYEQYGFLKGTLMTVWRVLRCNPWFGHGGYDPPRWFGEPHEHKH